MTKAATEARVAATSVSANRTSEGKAASQDGARGGARPPLLEATGSMGRGLEDLRAAIPAVAVVTAMGQKKSARNLTTSRY